MKKMRVPKSSRSSASGAPPDPGALVSEAMRAQALALDRMFSELLGHAADCRSGEAMTADRYVRLALRAQAGCRWSLMAMVRAERERRPARGCR